MINKDSLMGMIAAVPSDERFRGGRFSDWEQDNRNPPASMKRPKPLSKKQKAKLKSQKNNQ